MSSPRSLSLLRRVSLLAAVAALSASAAGAQSLTNNSLLTRPDTDAATVTPEPGESSSVVPAMDEPSSSDAATLASGVGTEVGGGAAAGQAESGWKGSLVRNFAFEAGGGFDAPVGNDTPYITWGGGVTVGAGYHFTKAISLLAEYQFLYNKLPGAFIAAVGTQGGNAHIWSLTLSPVVDLFPKKNNSIYLTGGGGFYRKLNNFTNPVQGEECTFYCGVVVINETVYHFSSNQLGGNAGIGFSHRLGGQYNDSNMKVFAEARYLFLNTPAITANNGLGTTELIPVSIGVRW
jgi:hypothetical protein